jgi:hypothetical protein
MRFIKLLKYELPCQAREMQWSEVKLKISLKIKKGMILNQGLYKRSKISILLYGQRISTQEPYSCAYKNSHSGLRTYQSKRTKFNFFISLNVVWSICITFNWFIFIKCCFYVRSIYYRTLNAIILYYLCPSCLGLERKSPTFHWLTLYFVNFILNFFCHSSSRNVNRGLPVQRSYTFGICVLKLP